MVQKVCYEAIMSRFAWLIVMGPGYEVDYSQHAEVRPNGRVHASHDNTVPQPLTINDPDHPQESTSVV